MTATAPRIGVGFVGLGATRGWAAQAHVPALAMLSDYAIRGLVASSPQSAAEAARKHEVPFATDSLDELLARDDIDLVVVTVRVPEHRRAVEAALRAGKAVFCEWPLARNLEEATALAELAQRSSLPCFVNLQGRTSPALRFIADLLREGQVGEVLSTSLIADGGSPWGRESVDQADAMYQENGNGATMLTIPFGHMLDALQSLFGELEACRSTMAVRKPFTRLRETGESIAVTAPDQVCVSGRFRGGAVASLHYRAGVRCGTRFHWEINGTDGDLIVRAPSGHFQFGRLEIRASMSGAKDLAELPIPQAYWPLAGHRASLAYNVALAYAAIASDLRNATGSAPTAADAVSLHRTLRAIESSSLQP